MLGERWKDGWNFNEHNYQRWWETDQRVTARSLQHSLLGLTLKKGLDWKRLLHNCFNASGNEWINNLIHVLYSWKDQQIKFLLFWRSILYLSSFPSTSGSYYLWKSMKSVLKNKVTCCFSFGTLEKMHARRWPCLVDLTVWWIVFW